MTIFLTADPHFTHELILQYCNRPFKTLKEMENALITNWNNVVSKNDIVYVLGDFSFGDNHQRYKKILKNLSGRKILIMGNHDDNRPRFYVSAGFESVHYPYINIGEYTLCHDPALSQVDRNRKFIIGHIHDLFVKHKNCVNCGVDVHNFTPQPFDYITSLFDKEDY